MARLVELHEQASPVVDGLTAALDRFGGYRRPAAAGRRPGPAGDGDWFDKPLTDSYHTVWFELHEDLLATLGLERAAETGGEG